MEELRNQLKAAKASRSTSPKVLTVFAPRPRRDCRHRRGRRELVPRAFNLDSHARHPPDDPSALVRSTSGPRLPHGPLPPRSKAAPFATVRCLRAGLSLPTTAPAT